MRPALAAAVTILFLATPAQGLTLLEDVDEGQHRRLRLRVDQPPLEAEASPNVTLADANASPELSRLEVPLREWRGFENTTTINASGAGRLLLVDEASGIEVSLEPNASSSPTHNASSPDGQETNASQRSSSPSSEKPERESPGSSPSAEGENAEASGHPSGSGAPPRAAASDEELEPETDEEGGEDPLGQPAAIALALLAVGAFLVERLMARRHDEDPP